MTSARGRRASGTARRRGASTFAYRTGKFIRRHRAAVAFAAVAAILVVAFAATAAVQSTQIARERDQVARERIAQFLAPRPLLEEALAERRRLFPGDNADVAASLSRLGLLLQIEGDLPERLARLYEIRGKTGKAR